MPERYFYTKYCEGMIIPELIGSRERCLFDMYNGGSAFLVAVNRPTEYELGQFYYEDKELRLTAIRDALWITLRVGHLNWCEAPFSPHLAKQAELPLSLYTASQTVEIILVDTDDGRVRYSQTFPLNSEFSAALRTGSQFLLQKEFDRDLYDEQLAMVQSRYDTDQIAFSATACCVYDPDGRIIGGAEEPKREPAEDPEKEYSERLCGAYSGLIHELAEPILDKLVRKLIRQFQAIKRDSGMLLSPEDCQLENLWDEICVQIQTVESFFWDAYEDYIDSIIPELVQTSCSKAEMKVIWLAGECFEEWERDFSFPSMEKMNDIFAEDDFPEGFRDEAVFSEVKHNLFLAAGNYTNQRIEDFNADYCDF